MEYDLPGVHLILLPGVTVGFASFYRDVARNLLIYPRFQVGISFKPMSI